MKFARRERTLSDLLMMLLRRVKGGAAQGQLPFNPGALPLRARPRSARILNEDACCTLETLVEALPDF